MTGSTQSHLLKTGLQAAATTVMAVMLSGCAGFAAPPRSVALNTPPQWFAPLPHEGSVRQLTDWWSQQGDPLLVELIDAAQVVSPTVLTAKAGIDQARATRVQATAALLPTLDATGSASRSRQQATGGFTAAPSNQVQAGLQTSWEIDVFGRNGANRAAAQERLDGTQARWHEARVSVAAEVARQYYSFRSCEKQVAVSDSDASSRAETARLSALASKAGFEAPATAALARASAAESKARATQQRASCEIDIKALVALTARSEPVLRQQLATAASPSLSLEGPASVAAVPALVLAQRPDVYSAAREVAAASFEVANADALRYPRLSLAGNITTGRVRTGGVSQSFDTWSIGPLSVSLPLFDGGSSRANLESARARYDDAAGKYRGVARQAVREVEEALVNLQSTADRTGDAAVAAEGYRASFAGTEARYKAGLASLTDLEDARRTLLAAQSAVVNLELERRNAWVALYRALGGGWTVDSANPPALAAAPLAAPAAP